MESSLTNSKQSTESKTEKTILELRNIAKHFGGIKAVDGVNICIQEGELHCLIGPNGAGKSTIFKLIMGLYSPTEGKVWFKGQEITQLHTWKRARLGLSIKMQIPGVYPELSLYENLRIAAQTYVEKHQLDSEMERLLKLVGIDHLGDPLVKNLSHGQQQWLEIAMALASKPDLLLLDEPAAGMGPEETAFTAQLVSTLNNQGLTILFIDHDMDFVRRIAQKVTVLHYGKLFAQGTISEIESNKDVIEIYLGNV